MTRTATIRDPATPPAVPALNDTRPPTAPGPGPDPRAGTAGPLPASMLALGARERFGAAALLLLVLWSAVAWALGTGA